MITKQITLLSRPQGAPTLDNFRFEDFKLPDIKDGQVLLYGLYYSVDPYMRGRMNDTPSYIPPFELGKPILGSIVASVTESRSDKFKPGDLILGILPWRQEIMADEKELQKIDTSFVPPSYYLSILGMTGLTAYFGIMNIGKPKKGESIVISAAAGAVGITAGQIAKILGCRVIGIVGSDEKAKLIKEEFGFDGAINYKTTIHLDKAIAELCPDGVDIYYDNVGGEISDAVIYNLNLYARIILCGQISLSNSVEIPIGPRIQPLLLKKSVLMQGFIIINYQNQFSEGINQLGLWIKQGKLKFKETVIHGFDQLPNAFLGLFNGANSGKMIVKT